MKRKKVRILAVIPARGGSKGVPRKNIRMVAGRPLIAWTISEAKKSGFVDRIIVSTDDAQIASVARKFGAEAPFMRPRSLATDKAGMIPVVIHALDWAEKEDGAYDFVLLLQPSSPLRTVKDINDAIKKILSGKRGSVVSVCEVDHPPHWSNVLPPSGSLDGFVKKGAVGKNRQQIRTFYRINGAIYIASAKYLKKNLSYLGPGAYAFIMGKEKSVDIDTEFDIKVADLLLKELKR